MMRYLLFVCLFLLATLSGAAQTQIVIGNNPDNVQSTKETKFHYIFENEKFITSRIELEFGANGAGAFRFKKKDTDEQELKLQVTAPVLEQINNLLTETNFLESTENYQHKKDFSHLGMITLDICKGAKQRKVTFSYTENVAINKLATIFRNLATQETRMFELEAVRQNDSLSMPAQLRFLDNELRSKSIADPERFTAFLSELKTDEAVPLIARNHAARILKEITKSK